MGLRIFRHTDSPIWAICPNNPEIATGFAFFILELILHNDFARMMMFVKTSIAFVECYMNFFLSQLFALEGVDDVLQIQILDFL
jgi:hypothetical protein